TLAKETANPLVPKSDEVGKAAEKREKEKQRKAEEKNRRQSRGEKSPEEKQKKRVRGKVKPKETKIRTVGWGLKPATNAISACLMTGASSICAAQPATRWGRMMKSCSRRKIKNRTSAFTIWTTARKR